MSTKSLTHVHSPTLAPGAPGPAPAPHALERVRGALPHPGVLGLQRVDAKAWTGLPCLIVERGVFDAATLDKSAVLTGIHSRGFVTFLDDLLRDPKFPFSGLYPGALIYASVFGGVGCLLGSSGEPTHLVTAGHLFMNGSRAGTPVFAAPAPGAAAERIGELVVDFLDDPPPAVGRPIDAALVRLLDAGVRMAKASLSAGRGPRLGAVLPFGQIGGLTGRVFRATKREPSAAATPERVPDAFDVSFEGSSFGDVAVRSTFRVEDVLLTQPITQPGDSGCPFFADGDPSFAIGLCTGGVTSPQDGSIFESLERAVTSARALPDCAELELWPPPAG